jgi:hypothetical protein
MMNKQNPGITLYGGSRDTWQGIAKDLSADRPSVGKRVRVTGGRKYKGKEGQVQRHMVDQFNPWKWQYSDGPARLMMEMTGTYGYRIQIASDDGSLFWIDADKVEVCK